MFIHLTPTKSAELLEFTLHLLQWMRRASSLMRRRRGMLHLSTDVYYEHISLCNKPLCRPLALATRVSGMPKRVARNVKSTETPHLLSAACNIFLPTGRYFARSAIISNYFDKYLLHWRTV